MENNCQSKSNYLKFSGTAAVFALLISGWNLDVFASPHEGESGITGQAEPSDLVFPAYDHFVALSQNPLDVLTLSVDLSFSEDEPEHHRFKSIQSALDFGASQAARLTIVNIRPGFYEENLRVHGGATLLNANNSTGDGGVVEVVSRDETASALQIEADAFLRGISIKGNGSGIGKGIERAATADSAHWVIIESVGISGFATALSNEGAEVIVFHSTIFDNSSNNSDAVILNKKGGVKILNSIVWNPNALIVFDAGNDQNIVAEYSIIDHGGFGGLQIDPLLAEDGRLTALSPAINLGEPIAELGGNDFEGDPRGINPDLGMDEYYEAVLSEEDAGGESGEFVGFGPSGGMGIMSSGPDSDGDGIPDDEDARPNDPNIGRLVITITNPLPDSLH